MFKSQHRKEKDDEHPAENDKILSKKHADAVQELPEISKMSAPQHIDKREFIFAKSEQQKEEERQQSLAKERQQQLDKDRLERQQEEQKQQASKMQLIA